MSQIMKSIVENDELFKNWAKKIICLHDAVTKGDRMGKYIEKNKDYYHEEFIHSRLCYLLKGIKRDDLRSHFMNNFLKESPTMSDWLKKHDKEVHYLTTYPYEEAMRLIRQKENEQTLTYQKTIEKEVEAVFQRSRVLFIKKRIDLSLEKKDKDQFIFWTEELKKDMG
jgi:hypothetical protein